MDHLEMLRGEACLEQAVDVVLDGGELLTATDLKNFLQLVEEEHLLRGIHPYKKLTSDYFMR